MSDGVAAAPSDKGVASLSVQRLIALFVVALLLFCVGRWNSDDWLQQQLLPRLLLHGVHATAVVREGGSLRLQQVVVDGVALAGSPVQWDEIVVAPKWSALLQLQPVAQITMRWHMAGEKGEVVAEVEQLDDDQLAIRQLKLQLPLAMVTPLLPAMPVTLAGDLLCQGAVVLHRRQMQLAQPNIVCDWQQATATMGGKPMPLGSYQLTLKSVDANWHWSLTGGDVAKVEAEGLVHPASSVAMAAWPIDGALTVHAGKGALGAMVGAMLGAQSHTIGGQLAAPEFH